MLEPVTGLLTQILLASLRLGPVLAFAPPFTLIKTPTTVRLILVVTLAAAVGLNGTPAEAVTFDTTGALATAAASELALGIALALPLQLAFAMIAVAGRALDIQAGFGLAFLIDPTTRAQTPLIGTVFTYAAAAIFFATGAQHDLIAILAVTFEQVPVGSGFAPHGLGDLLTFLSAVSIAAFGAVGLAILVLFIIDLVVAMVSRTLPQMNVLVLGFQVKSMATILILPATLGLAAAVIVRIVRLTLDAMLRII